jgi:hypothetical protein
MFMSDKIFLTNMTRAIAECYFKEFVIDAAVFSGWTNGEAVSLFRWLADRLSGTI